MKKRIIAIMLSLVLVLAFTSCTATPSSDGTSETEPDAQTESNDSAANEEEIVIDILWQQEITETFMQEPIKALEEKYPNVTVNLEVSPEAYSEINNRLASGNAPDIFFSWVSDVDYYGMANEGLLYSVDDFLNMQTLEEDQTMKERITSFGVERGNFDGSHYLLPVTKFLAINFYNDNLMSELGVEPDFSTYDKFVNACDTIAQTGEISPVIYSGVYSFMPLDGFLYPMIASADPAAMEAINNEEPGAWINPTVVETVEKWEELITSGYVTENSLPMDHIQSQIEFINDRAAFIPVGTWLEGEMAGQWPEDFALTPFLAPAMGDNGQYAVQITEYMILPKQEDDSALPYVYELLRELYSYEMAENNLATTGGIPAFETLTDNMTEMLPQSVAAAYALEPNLTYPDNRIKNKDMLVAGNNGINALTSGDMTALEFCEEMESYIG